MASANKLQQAEYLQIRILEINDRKWIKRDVKENERPFEKAVACICYASTSSVR